jgi:hypothetical protein
MGLRGRFFSTRDMRLIHSFNHELMDDIVQAMVSIFKVNAEQTKTNIYGEVDQKQGVMFFPGVDVTCRIKKDLITTKADDFGPDRSQNINYVFLEKDLRTINLFPETGDVILFNERYYEIDNVVQEQFLGDIEDKSFSIICHTHYSRLSKLSIVTRQS